ncbi:redoxin family protein [Piscinibacterium candidicorallinum]|jgi:thiol-disulfide isomerase/thioredoxin|uniref:Redoxin family protein n=1 Tax=Piscinibacterium candidicorallinum TaxID=1793872 RepID=A0ABV7HBL5_9BURK
MKKLIPIAVGLTALAVGAGLSWWRLAPTEPVPAAAQSFYAAQFKDADGQAVDLNQFKGKLTVVNFWATWCAPCVEEMPEFERVAKDKAAAGVRFVGIGIDSPSNIREFRQKVTVSYPLVAAGFGGSELGKAFGNQKGALPYTVLLGPNGQVLNTKLGRLHEDELRGWLKTALAGR